MLRVSKSKLITVLEFTNALGKLQIRESKIVEAPKIDINRTRHMRKETTLKYMKFTN